MWKPKDAAAPQPPVGMVEAIMETLSCMVIRLIETQTMLVKYRKRSSSNQDLKTFQREPLPLEAVRYKEVVGEPTPQPSLCLVHIWIGQVVHSCSHFSPRC